MNHIRTATTLKRNSFVVSMCTLSRGLLLLIADRIIEVVLLTGPGHPAVGGAPRAVSRWLEWLARHVVVTRSEQSSARCGLGCLRHTDNGQWRLVHFPHVPVFPRCLCARHTFSWTRKSRGENISTQSTSSAPEASQGRRGTLQAG